MIPRATVRLQLHAGFTFDDARAVLDHYAELGVSHLYLSPITQALPGSPHGYDVADPTRVNEELGGLPGLCGLAREAASRGLGLIADIVPNHMAADPRNPWWRDVLRHGPHSAWATFFDIDWAAGGGRLLLPVLPQPYGDSLAAGDIRLAREGDETVVRAGGQSLPLATGAGVAPQTYDPDDDAGRARLHQLLERQHYRLAWWRAAAERLNWRRFFEISGLVGLRVEDDAVFDASHALILELYREGVLDGLRVDHIDGLAEPGAYLRRLRAALIEAAPARQPYLVVEKILAPHESLDPRWPVDGTTGYDFMDEVSALLHAPAARRPLQAFWQACGGLAAGPEHQLRGVRERILERHLAGERRAAVAAWQAVLEADPHTRDWGPDALQRVLVAWLAGFPVYRSYAEDGGPSAADRAVWDEAARHARPRLAAPDPMLLDQWMARLREAANAAPALRRLQQLTPPLAAKSLEDTLHYRLGMLLSRNEVGAWPQRFALGIGGLHERNVWRARRQPLGMLATATHDHKRGEDVRARLAVLTEMPRCWTALAREWLDTLPAGLPATTDRYMLLQTLVGAWPSAWGDDVRAVDPDAVRDWLARVAAWQRKALREAKLRSSWTDPDLAYEQAALACIEALDPTADDPRPLDALASLAAPLVAPGHINGLTQALLRNTAPGVPDLYQGTEIWDESLVDPDNRRPVDYVHLRRLLAQPPPTRPLPAEWRSGRVKQHVIQAALGLRTARPWLFDERSAYIPLGAVGARAAHVVAYLRGRDGRWALVAAPRACALRIAGYARGEAALASGFWKDTALILPPGCAGRWDDALGDGTFAVGDDGRLRLSRLLESWPVALCAKSGP